MKTKIFTLILALTASIWVINAQQIDGIWYSLDSDNLTAVVVSDPESKYSGAVVIPDSVIYEGTTYQVTSIGYGAFYECSTLTSIKIPNSVTSIGEYAFRACWSLTSIVLPNQMKRVENRTFLECSGLSSVTIPNGITSIGDAAFGCCRNLTSVIIPEGVTLIGSNALYNCSKLNTVTFPSSLTIIAQDVFGGSYNVRNIYVPCGEIERFRNLLSNVGNVSSSSIKYAPSYSISKTIKNGSIQESSHNTACDTLVTLTVNPNTGYHFVQWSDSITENPRNIILIKDTAFTAELARNQYSVTTASSNSEWGEAAGDATVLYLDTITLTATANHGYHFTRWSDGNTQNPRRYVVTKNIKLTAQFSKNIYNVTKVVFPRDWGAIIGNNTVTYSDSVVLTAKPNYGYRFIQWYDGFNDNPRTFRNITQDFTAIAEFAKNPRIVYNYDKMMGYIIGDTTIANVSADSVTFSATANYGYHFVQWNDSITDNPRTIYLDKDTTFAAEFAPNYYSLRTETNYSERGTTQGDTIAPYLTSIQISATPNYGYYFDSWSDGNHYNPRSMNLRGDTTFTAYFEKIEYAVSIIADSTMGIVSGVSRANYLDTLTILATPNHGYHFVQWSDSVTDNPRTFVLTRDTAFTAEFAQTFAGQCGDSLYWNFNNDSLVFSGSGDMYNYVPDSLPWALLINQTKNIEFAQEMTSISAYAFQNMGNLSKLNLSAKIFTIGDFAFENCSLLNYVTIPNSVISLGDSAFNGCSSIDTLIIGTGIRTITNQFRGCMDLRYLQLGQGVKSIDYGSFYDARQLIFIVCHPTLPPLAYPDEVGKERSFYNTNAQVLIPCDNFDAYQYDALWGSFNLKCLSSNSGTAVDGQVIVVAGDAEATFTWPTDGSADTYNLEITKDSATFCSLIFDSEGRLLGIAFAPSVNGHQPHMPAATMTTKGMSFQVTGLDYASQYRFSFETKDDNTQTIFAYTGGFHTNGTDAPEGFKDINVDGSAPQKVMIDGQIFILRGDKTYTLQGQEVR